MQKYLIILLLFCNIIHGICYDDTQVSETKVLKSEDQNVVDSSTRSNTNAEENLNPNKYLDEDKSHPNTETKPYEVFEDIAEAEYIPLPYHIQKLAKNKKNNSTEDLLQTAESRYETSHTYQVTENIEEEEEYENKIDNEVPKEKRTYPQHFQNPHYTRINNNDHGYSDYEQANKKTRFTIVPKQQLFTTAVFKKEEENEKQPLSVIFLQPISKSNQVQKPIRVKVLKPVVVSNENSYPEENGSGNIIINNDDKKPILALRVLKSYIANNNRFDYQHHTSNAETHKNNYKPILINMLKSNNYRNFYKSLLNEEYVKNINNEKLEKDLSNINYYNKNANRSKPERYESEQNNDYESKYGDKQTSEEFDRNVDGENKTPDQQKRYFIYLVDKQKPYVNIRRVNKHR